MNYELLNIIYTGNKIWADSKKRITANNGTALMLAPSPSIGLIQEQENIPVTSLIDQLTGRVKYNSTKEGYFFNDFPKIDLASITMNRDGSISAINDGVTVAQVSTYPNTRRIVKEVRYLTASGDTDYIEEYTNDGFLYSNLFYTRNEIQEIDFYDENQFAVVRYFFYEGNLNYIRVYNAKTKQFEAEYNNNAEFYVAQLAKLVGPKDTIGINYMGIELIALEQTTSDNTLYLNEDPLDETGHLKGNLSQILTNQIKYVQHVVMSEEMANKIPKDIAHDKIIISK
ncbi:hypothetical protein KAR50_05025 [Periweissella fabaria]|uniref:UDP-N-acetylglucosamine--peptide N-acetylglucosaminyltransferase stabilizing protein GtfB n=1 Tax=Periweissella fabaria TaxID=546157 RepID=A0ABN8BEW0_9LACO|nr:hypothetical protein [Periweissella fabaria]MCM0597202.1 hypothetical protein [Periweissella fabaria]CAH0416293.1 UDP-N-acetylglucosamine--peptide N-acetylglucosaminyltransferase stabilizing protein GtfB [Periweissella fabaria]